VQTAGEKPPIRGFPNCRSALPPAELKGCPAEGRPDPVDIAALADPAATSMK